ncbi:MAG: hypothetical protein FWB83_05880 [Treponema sp.]|nr:hypothetical protein [Treponema sp.]
METTMDQNYRQTETFEQFMASIKAHREESQADIKAHREESQADIKARREEFEKEMSERDKKFRKEMRERDEKFRKEMDEKVKESDKRLKILDKRMGYLSNRFGEIAEHLVAPGIRRRFNEMGYHFQEVMPGGTRIFDESNGKIKTEIDLLFENTDTIMAVEVKVKPAFNHIEHHIKRLEILCECRRNKNDNRKIHGAIAGAIFGPAEKKAVADAGLFVIEQSGDTMKIDVPDGFIPRGW